MKGSTFAFVAVVVRSDCLLLQKILDHFDDLAIIVVAEVETEVPGVVEGDGFVAAVAAYDFREDLACEVVAYY